jgi:hypothetical protein
MDRPLTALLDEEPMRANPYLRRAMANFGSRAGAGSAYFLIALMICFVIAELFLRVAQAYF